jgi:hypothetical protein
VFDFINNSDQNFDKIYYSIPTNHQININSVKDKVQLLDGIPDFSFFQNKLRKLLILDDFSSDKNEIDKITKIFTRVSHHTNTSVFFITQNLFERNIRTITLNSQYLILFKNPRDLSQIKYLARQIFPDTPQLLMEAYINATDQPFGYLIVDLSPRTDNKLRLYTDVFTSPVFYVVKKDFPDKTFEL